MKISVKIVILLITGLLLAAGCRKKVNLQSDDADEQQSVAASMKFYPRGFAAIQNTHLYSLSLGELEWIAALDFGEKLELNPDEVQGEIKQGKPIIVNQRDMYIDDYRTILIPVIWKDRRGWVNFLHYAAEGSQVGVVVEPIFESRYDNSLKSGDLVVFDIDSKNKILYAPFYGYQVSEAVSNNSILFYVYEIEMAKLLAKAKTTRNSDQARVLLNEAAQRYPTSALIPLITELFNTEPQNTDTSMESLAAVFSTASDKTPVYAAPDFASAVINHLEQYENVTSIERTIEPDTSKAGKARWYHIDKPLNGWIFGLDLESAD